MTSLARYLCGWMHQLLGDYNSFGDRMGIGPMLNSIRYPQKSVLWSLKWLHPLGVRPGPHRTPEPLELR